MKAVDASAIIDTLTGSPRSSQLIPILDDDLFAPDLLIPVTTDLRLARAAAGVVPVIVV